MLTLYYAPRSRASCALFMMHEVGEPFRLEVLNLKRGDQKRPEYLAVNPMGKVPALRDGEALVTELPAVLGYLADRYPKAGLAPAFDDPARGTYLRWMHFNGSCLEPAVMDAFMKRETPPATAGWGTLASVLDTISAGLDSGGPWLLGNRYSAADVLMGSSLAYMLGFGILPKRPEYLAYVERMNARPAKRLADEDEARHAAAQAG